MSTSTDAVQTSIEVAVDPAAAFAAFTDDIDQWYVVDEHTVPDITRTKAIRFEPYVGGRLLDVHDETTGEGRAIATVTDWEPGERLAFTDARETTVEVTFVASGDGTRVTLVHSGLDRLPGDEAEHVRRHGWQATLLPWFEQWHGRADGITFGTVTPYLYYADAGAALDWLERVFGWGPQHRMTDASGAVREASIEVGPGHRIDICGRESGPNEGGGALLIVAVSDVDALHERIAAAGVEVSDPNDEAYGPRQIHCTDAGGYRWYFWQGQARYPEV